MKMQALLQEPSCDDVTQSISLPCCVIIGLSDNIQWKIPEINTMHMFIATGGLLHYK